MIRTRALARSFRSGKHTVEAVRGVDLDVAEGELVALLGPNGAGKTTLLRMLTTLLPPTAGAATVAGYDVRTDAARVRARIGVVGQGHGLGESQRARDELLTQARLYGVGRREARARADELLEMLELTGVADRGTPSLSGGQKRRLDIALGLVHRPRMLFLDEPSTGLDPQSRANLWGHVARLRAEHGTTVLVTTHYLDEADGHAERAVVVDHGTVIADGTPDALKGQVPGDRVTLDDVFLNLTGRSLREGE
ncbi:ATP-binding cassette domain-containing protein [Nocardiopsis sp. HNM0947]|uniref:ATP-binding cassette domain-containing protein n=1 Tax=Nocardiopsis coralli TaxID=2772213 RepID=A0ABR9PEM5_9ACTN|nr:ATP-binding cassette domain-containing protein [Nocardiopsis coralli]MBE3002287.1 ATP-binding cassette domain-containing protein [Nocardiopsis coralli]